MTCPSCGRIAGAGLERCPSCHSSLAIPTDRPDTPTPIVRAPTNRGELAQRAAGIFARSLVPHRTHDIPDQPVTGGAPRPGLVPPPPPPPPIGGLAGEPIPVTPVLPGAPGRHVDPAKPSLAPPDARSSNAGPAPLGTDLAAGWAIQSPPPPPVAGPAFTSGAAFPSDPVARQAPPGANAALDATAAFPAVSAATRDLHAAADGDRPGEDPTEEQRPRTVRPGVDAAWPPPPGPWSGRRTSES